ncbi:hypothetical protein RFI_08620 [Reticulomyxa filosa]|uniref:Protein kinase domain-containing protein n=1 Tax=Reticulomyxa filosa TaxID=46433 RepID=X6NR76_RETFI|nr:hypothetical protein RFI_08620 [Reticulomyxa filosa]|eukprot:ETO28511.1 hypothetical protein RFI_08620 [Reticulomyxa filosa]
MSVIKKIDVWSVGCVISELFLTTPLFQGERSVDQLVEIIKVLGTPTRREIAAMNPNYTYSNFPTVKPLSWSAVFEGITYDSQVVPNDAIDLLSKFLIFTPSERLTAFDALAHPYFDELRSPDLEFGPNLFNFTQDEIEVASKRKVLHTILPKEYWEQFGIQSNKDTTGGSGSFANSTLSANTNGDVKATAKGSTSTASSVNADQQYVLSRVQEIAEERQLVQPTKSSPQKN